MDLIANQVVITPKGYGVVTEIDNDQKIQVCINKKKKELFKVG